MSVLGVTISKEYKVRLNLVASEGNLCRITSLIARKASYQSSSNGQLSVRGRFAAKAARGVDPMYLNDVVHQALSSNVQRLSKGESAKQGYKPKSSGKRKFTQVEPSRVGHKRARNGRPHEGGW